MQCCDHHAHMILYECEKRCLISAFLLHWAVCCRPCFLLLVSEVTHDKWKEIVSRQLAATQHRCQFPRPASDAGTQSLLIFGLQLACSILFSAPVCRFRQAEGSRDREARNPGQLILSTGRSTSNHWLDNSNLSMSVSQNVSFGRLAFANSWVRLFAFISLFRPHLKRVAGQEVKMLHTKGINKKKVK